MVGRFRHDAASYLFAADVLTRPTTPETGGRLDLSGPSPDNTAPATPPPRTVRLPMKQLSRPRSRLRVCKLVTLTWAALAAIGTLLAPRLPAAEGPGGRSGEQIFRQDCARCHGKAGEGTEDYPQALEGDRSVPQLARLISRTMPEDDPGTCVGEDADKVAAYIHEAFYSRAAREGTKPPRVELSRLTVRQYQNAVADLIGRFRTAGKWDGERGLHGEYFKSKSPRAGRRVIDRRDPVVRFDFGEHSPDDFLIDPFEFSISWEGSVLAPESGDYEFIVRTEHAARLFVNDTRKPLIDAWVKSGDDTEYRGTIRLIGGRAYPLRLEYSKAKQGVDDSKKKKKTPPPLVRSSVTLLWKQPKQVEEVVPERCLSPNKSPEAFVLTTPFPPDDRSVGYEKGTSISKAWDQAATDAAIEVATYVTGRLREFADATDGDKEREKKLREFSVRFTERAFRRPLTDELKQLYVDRQFQASKDLDTAVKRVVLLALKSPRFLYREAGGGLDGHDVASRLSFGLWDSIPDAALIEAAAAGKLESREQVVAQAERMVADLRAKAKVREFLLQWLKVDQVPDVSKDPKLFQGFDAAVASDLRTSLDLFLEEVVWGEASDFRQLLLTDSVYLNGRLAKLYGADLPPDAPFTKVPLDPKERAGVLTHPYLMSVFAYTSTSSPIYRGVFLARSVLGRALRPPPIAVSPLPPELHAGLTTRERITVQTSPASCITCHAMINPLGFPLEHFDAIGRYRGSENDKPVDATGSYQALSGESVTFTGARDLGTFLAGSEETHTAFVRQLFQNLVKQPIRAFGVRTQADLQKSFVEHGFSIRKLVAEVAATAALPPPDTKRLADSGPAARQ
jgi:mono/diheme cytochrome c family protein